MRIRVSESLPDVRDTAVLSELLYFCPRAMAQTSYTVPHVSPETLQWVCVATQ